MRPGAVVTAEGKLQLSASSVGYSPPPCRPRSGQVGSLPATHEEADPSPLLSPVALAVHSCDSNLLQDRQILLTSGPGRPGSAAAAPGRDGRGTVSVAPGGAYPGGPGQ